MYSYAHIHTHIDIIYTSETMKHYYNETLLFCMPDQNVQLYITIISTALFKYLIQ